MHYDSSMRSFRLYCKNEQNEFHERGFTLVELAVALAIIGFLSAASFTALGSFRERSRDSVRISDIRQIALAMELNRNQNDGIYNIQSPTMPTTIGTELHSVPANNYPAKEPYEWIDNTGASSSRFCVWAQLENSELGDYFVGNHIGSGYQDEAPSGHFGCNFLAPSVSINGNGDQSPAMLCHCPPGHGGNKCKTIIVDADDTSGHLNNHPWDYLGACS